MHKIINKILYIFIFLFFISFNFVNSKNLEINFFYGDGCPHCEKEKIYLDSLNKEYPIKINAFEIYNNKNNFKILENKSKELGIEIKGIPALFIENKYISGFNETTTPEEIKKTIEYCIDNDCKINEKINEKIKIPLIGEINPSNFSLPIITIILGFLDGFNPCAMWVLLFLISLLLGIKDRKKMWILGVAFIFSSAMAYFLFMSAWLNILLFIGFIFFVRLIIAGIAMVGGTINIVNFFQKKKESGCDIIKDKKRIKIFDKIKKILNKKNIIISVLGISILAFSVNLIEILCSAGLPAIYVQILTLNKLNILQYYLYILLYILFFMIDDLIIFFIAMITLEATGITTKYSKIIKLISGLLMFLIGLALIFNPGLLMLKIN